MARFGAAGQGAAWTGKAGKDERNNESEVNHEDASWNSAARR
jgi:hypothetical protein